MNSGQIIISFVNQYVAFLGHNAYVGRPKLYSTIEYDELIDYAAKAAGINKSDMYVCMEAITDAFSYFLCNGHAFKIDGVGTFSLAMSAATADPTSSEDPTGADAVSHIGVNFLPDVKLKAMLSALEITTEPSNPNNLAEYAIKKATSMVIGEQKFNFVNYNSAAGYAVISGQKVVVKGYNLPDEFTVSVYGDTSESCSIPMKLSNIKSECEAIGVVPKSVDIAKVTKVEVLGMQYEYTGEAAQLYVKIDNQILASGSTYVQGIHALEITGQNLSQSDWKLDDSSISFSSATSKKLTASIQLTTGSHTLTGAGKSYTFNVAYESTTPNITALTSNGVSVSNGGSSEMQAGTTYQMVASGYNLQGITQYQISLPSGASISNYSATANQIKFSLTFGNTAGTIKIGNYFTVNINLPAAGSKTITSVNGIASGGTSTSGFNVGKYAIVASGAVADLKLTDASGTQYGTVIVEDAAFKLQVTQAATAQKSYYIKDGTTTLWSMTVVASGGGDTGGI